MFTRDRPHLDAALIVRDRTRWTAISRHEAVHLSRVHPVAVLYRSQSRDVASWFDTSNRFYKTDGPYLYDSLRYYLLAGSEKPWLKSLGKLTQSEPVEWEPLEAMDESGEPVPLGSPVRKEKPKHPIEFRLTDGAGKSIADAEYEVVLPDGTVRRGKSDADGFVRIPDNLHPGEARLKLIPKHIHHAADASRGGGETASPEPNGIQAALEGIDVSTLIDAAQAIRNADIPKVPDIPKIPRPVEILLTNENGHPMIDTPFRLRFPDGKIESGNSDKAGLIRFPDNTQAGDMLLSLPGLDRGAAS
ncbi:MAG: hypothetical protein JWP91_3044 [Fibrobacteres bacterium]|nr:hypothetical protein [Fibrobacterota bacterium]